MRSYTVFLHMCLLCIRLGWGKTIPAQPLEVTYCCQEGQWWNMEQEQCLQVETGTNERMTGTLVVVGGRQRTLYSGGVRQPHTGRGITVSPVNVGGTYTKRKPGGGSQAILTDYGGLSVFYRTITRKVEESTVSVGTSPRGRRAA